MDKEKIDNLIERMKNASNHEFEGIVKEVAKENHMKPGDVWQLLKLNGFDPKAKSNSPTLQSDEKKQSVILSHKTPYPAYRRAGLVLKQTPATYEVTDAQLAQLKKDAWVVIGDGKKDGTEK